MNTYLHNFIYQHSLWSSLMKRNFLNTVQFTEFIKSTFKMSIPFLHSNLGRTGKIFPVYSCYCPSLHHRSDKDTKTQLKNMLKNLASDPLSPDDPIVSLHIPYLNIGDSILPSQLGLGSSCTGVHLFGQAVWGHKPWKALHIQAD